MSKSKIIITADDFGKSQESDRRIFALIRQKKIDRVAVMIDRNLNDEKVKELISSKVKLDLHLELPFAKEAKKNKIFKRSFFFIINFISGKNRVSLVKKDWERQINKFRLIFGKLPDGINSHEYVHLFPPFFKIALDLSTKYKIPHLRFGRKKYFVFSSPVCLILNIVELIDRRYFIKNKSNCTNSSDYRVSLDWIKDFQKFQKNLPAGETEIICHPEREEEFMILKNLSR